MNNQADAAYPKRPPFFAHRFVRLLTRAAVAQFLKPEACWLLAVIAHQEDAVRYSRGVTYYNEQLMPLCGFGSKKRLVEARKKAIEAGWLHYETGGKGQPGTYWVKIPDQYQDTPDGPCDAGDDSISRSDSERQPERETDQAPISRSDSELKTERQPHPNRNGKGSPFNPIPNNPAPDPKRERAHKQTPTFVKPTLEDVAAYCREIKSKIDPERFIDHYDSNGWRVGGKTAMKDWRATVRNWTRDEGNHHGNGNGRSTSTGKRTLQVGPGQRHEADRCDQEGSV